MSQVQIGIGGRIAVAALGLAVGLGLIEGGVRLRQRLKYGTASNTVFDMIIDDTSGLRIPKPGSETGAIRINTLGFRSPELETPKPDGRIRLAFLGDSTSFCAEVSGNESTWPHRVWQTVQASSAERTFDYVNAGVPGYSTEESLRNLQTRVARLEPDVIFIYHGSNDLSFDSRALATERGLFHGKAEEPSLAAQWSTAWYLVEKNLQLRARQSRAEAQVDRLEFDPETLSAPFEKRLRQLVAAAQQVAPVVVLGTFSIHARPDQTPAEQLRACNTSLYYMPYMSVAGLITAFAEYDRVIREVARDTGAVLVEVADAVPGTDRYFADSIHFTDSGAEVVAALMSQQLLAAPRFQTLLAQTPGAARPRPDALAAAAPAEVPVRP